MVLFAFLVASYNQAAEIRPEHVSRMSYPVWSYGRHGDPEKNRMIVEQVLKMTGDNVTEAARMLGVSRGTVRALRQRGSKASL